MNPEPIATYRVQLRPGFGFDQAADLVPYLADLGVSHLYASPYLQAAAGSAHGYDVVDPSRVNEELGGAGAHARLCETLKAAGLGQMVDMAPNHMAISGRQNPWWWDVLENGPSSRYADYFDVDWAASEERWPNKVLLPVLGDHYGRILEEGGLRLSHEGGAFMLHYEDQVFPLDPSSLAGVLSGAAESCGSETLAFLAESHARLPRPAVAARPAAACRHRDKTVLSNLLARLCRETPEAAAAITAEVDRLNRHPDAVDSLIDQQNYRLAFWRTANRDLGYRRFFDIKDLAGLRVEDIEVFRAAHALPMAWFQKGWVQGFRIDHPDGLRDPAEYFRRLNEACPGAWIVAEKILESDEKLPSDWPVAGTTGYDFLNRLGGVFINPRGEEEMTRIYEDFTRQRVDFAALITDCKRQALETLFGSEISRLASLFVDICERHRQHRDYTRQELRDALCETAVYFPVYRSYVSAARNVAGWRDEHWVGEAIERAAAQRADLDPELFLFLKHLLLLRIPGPLEGELAMRFQQLTGPAMAKGVEDTAFYRFHRLIALNEVGGNPDRFGLSIEHFHEFCAAAQAERPLTLLASTTHDTKRSEDVRARLSVLSEIPELWGQTVKRWAGRNRRHRRSDSPDGNAEYVFYQTLVGAWPIDSTRMTAYMEKAAREGKTHTSWTRPNEDYEKDLRVFIAAVMQDDAFIADLQEFVASVVHPGRINSLSQTLIRLTAPGVPDIYQGTELWDLSLVDPDNRRPVDFALRRRLLAEMLRLSPDDILARMDEGLPKLFTIRQALHLRHKRPELFGPEGAYRPLHAGGEKADHVIAFMRGADVITVAPRWPVSLNGDWADTEVELPAGRWRNLLSGENEPGGAVRLARLLSRFPLGLLIREEGGQGG
jgi:(1->4)-alpha-D-glucan 1-alpha-D-glucosylmutase